MPLSDATSRSFPLPHPCCACPSPPHCCACPSPPHCCACPPPDTSTSHPTAALYHPQPLPPPLRAGVGAVMLDELHERSLDGDLALTLLLDARRTLNPGLRVVVASATLGGGLAERCAEVWGRAYGVLQVCVGCETSQK
eukprot:365989-Chlamydomonas_euryale.AAC.4